MENIILAKLDDLANLRMSVSRLSADLEQQLVAQLGEAAYNTYRKLKHAYDQDYATFLADEEQLENEIKILVENHGESVATEKLQAIFCTRSPSVDSKVFNAIYSTLPEKMKKRLAPAIKEGSQYVSIRDVKSAAG